MQSRSSRSDAVRKALLQAKMETGGTVKAASPQTDYKEKIDRLKSKTQELKSQQVEVNEPIDLSSLNIEQVSSSQQSVDTVSEEDEYVRVSVSNDQATSQNEVNGEEKENAVIVDTSAEDVALTEVSETPTLSTDDHILKSGSSEEIVVDSPIMVESVSISTEKHEEILPPTPPPTSISKKAIGLPTPMNSADIVPEGPEFHKSHAVFTVSRDIDISEIYNVWVPFNCSWEDLTEAIQNKVKINSNKSILKMVLMENTGDVLSPDIKTATKFFKIFQNFESGNSTFLLTIDLEAEALLQTAKDLAAFRAAALRLTFINHSSKEEKFVYLTRNFEWTEILNAIVLEYSDISPNWISHIIMMDSDGDEISPPISSVEKFWKFTRTASMHNGDMFTFFLDPEIIAADAKKDAEEAFLASCQSITLQITNPFIDASSDAGADAPFTALVPLNGDWDMIRKQIALGNPEGIRDSDWIVQLLLVDSENDNLSPNIDGDSMFWKVFPTFNKDYDMKFLITLDETLMTDYARLKALEEYRASSKHLRIALANDQSAKVGDLFVPHQCEWELLTEGVADYLNLSTASWIDSFVLLDHEHDPISPPLKNITMFWKACEKFSIDRGMVLNVYLKPEALNTLKELAFLSKANSFCVRLAAADGGDGDVNDLTSAESLEANRVYVNPDSNWKEMGTAIAQTLHLDSYEWIENVVLIDEEGDILSPSIKTTEKFWRFYKKSLDKSIFLVNQDEALKAGAIANKRKLEEDAQNAKLERDRLDRAGMKVFPCLVFDHEVVDGPIPPLECEIRVHSACSWEEIFQAIDNAGVTESIFVKYVLLADPSGQKLSVPIKDAKMFWKFASSAEKGSASGGGGNHFEIHLDYARRTEILRNREQERIRNMQKKIEVAAAVGDKSTTVLLFSDSTWDDIRTVLIGTSGFSDQLEGSCIDHVVLYDIDGDQLSPELRTAEAFWGTYQTIYEYDRNMQFVITLDQTECDRVLALKAHEAFVSTAFKFKLRKKTDPKSMKDVLVAPKALWKDVVLAITEVFSLDSPTWVHHIGLFDGEGDPLSKNVNENTLFWKTAASYHYEDSKYFMLYIDNVAVEETKRQQAHEAFMAAAEHISIRKANSSLVTTGAIPATVSTLHAIFDSPWAVICKAIVTELNLSANAKVTQLTLIDEEMDELSPSVCTAEKFWKIYKNNYKQNSNMSFAVEFNDDSSSSGGNNAIGEGDCGTESVEYKEDESELQEEVVTVVEPKLSRKEQLDKDRERYDEEVSLTQQLAPNQSTLNRSPEEECQQEDTRQEEYQYPYIERGYDNHNASIVRSVKEKDELEAAYLQACVSKNLDDVIALVEQEGIDPLAMNKNKSTGAHFACAGGEEMCPVELIMKLYQYGLDLNSSNVSGARPISSAVLAGDVDACRCLMHYCPEIDLNSCGTDTTSITPLLHQAVDNSNIGILMWLHEMQVNVNIINSSGMSAVMLAVEATPFELDILQYLVMEMGADLYLGAPGDYTPFHAAANTGNIPAAEFLYEMGMHVDCQTSDGKTPLMFACSQGHLELAKILHAQGASLYSCGGKVDKLNTSLHLAAQFGHLDIIQWLVEECRLNPSPKNSKNAAPVDFARAAKKMDVHQWLTEWISTHPDSGESCEFKEYESLEETLFRNDFNAAMGILEQMSDRFTKDTVLPHGTTPLHYVAASGYMDLAKYLVQEGCAVNWRTSAGRTPLHYAAFKGHTDMCMYLYEVGASVNETDNGGLTCLKIAEQNNYQSLVLWLRSVVLKDKSGGKGSGVTGSGAKLPHKSSPTANSSSPFGGFFSCVSAAPETVNQNLGSADDEDDNTYNQYSGNEQHEESGNGNGSNNNTIFKLAVQLHEACILGDLALAKDLVEKSNAPVNGSPTFPNPLLPVDEQELTPLHGAVSSGHLPLVKFLVNKGAHVNAQNVGGLFNANENSEAMTPLHIACDKQHESIVMYLVGMKADLYKKNMAGDTSLHIICLLGLHALLRQIVDLPRSTLPDLNLDVRSSHLLNLLHCAADAGSIETAEILVENNVGVNSFDDEKKTPMHYACAKGSLDCVKLLVNNGAIVDLADTSGRTPFLFACSADNLDLMKYLSERGAQLDHESAKGNTALHIACKFGRLEIVQWLVENGLKADRINSSGHSPLYYAQSGDFSAVVEWLESI